MLNILNNEYFTEYYTKGYIDTQTYLSADLVAAMKAHYQQIPENRNDYPQYFKKNEHQASLEGRLIGLLFKWLPQYSEKMVHKLYSNAYSKAAHTEQVFIEPVCQTLLAQGFAKFFKTRYLVASYDIYLGNDYLHKSFTDIHSDIPNFHHFYETESDLTIYIPLIALNADNGGRLKILPEAKSKLKVPGNVLLKILVQFFQTNPDNLDANGYIDADKISDADMQAFINSDAYQELLQNYKTSTDLVRDYYADEFVLDDWAEGQAVLFTNKNFHAAESWLNQHANREIYMLRLLPIYDCKIKLKNSLHGRSFNNYLIDMQTGRLDYFADGVDVSALAEQDKLSL